MAFPYILLLAQLSNDCSNNVSTCITSCIGAPCFHPPPFSPPSNPPPLPPPPSPPPAANRITPDLCDTVYRANVTIRQTPLLKLFAEGVSLLALEIFADLFPRITKFIGRAQMIQNFLRQFDNSTSFNLSAPSVKYTNFHIFNTFDHDPRHKGDFSKLSTTYQPATCTWNTVLAAQESDNTPSFPTMGNVSIPLSMYNADHTNFNCEPTVFRCPTSMDESTTSAILGVIECEALEVFTYLGVLAKTSASSAPGWNLCIDDLYCLGNGCGNANSRYDAVTTTGEDATFEGITRERELQNCTTSVGYNYTVEDLLRLRENVTAHSMCKSDIVHYSFF